MSPEEAVRAFFDCYTNGRPEDFDACVAPDYVDYGHEPPGIGPDGARADYENAIKLLGGLIRYAIDALVVDGDMVAAAWTGRLPEWRRDERTEPVPGYRGPAQVHAARADRGAARVTAGCR